MLNLKYLYFAVSSHSNGTTGIILFFYDVYISGAKFKELCTITFLEIFLIQSSIVLVEQLMTPPLSSLT